MTSSIESQPSQANRRIRIAVFVCYALTLFTLTHWPQLELPPVVKRPDLIVHFVAFGLWTLLLNLSGFVGRPLAIRTTLIALPLGVVYSGIDEGLQAIPWVRRYCALDDFLANCGGVSIVTLAALAWAALRRPATPAGHTQV